MSTRAMLVVPAGALAETSQAVTALAIDGWRQTLLVHELPRQPSSTEEDTNSVLDAAAHFTAKNIFVPRGLVLDDRAVKAAGLDMKRLDNSSRDLRRANSSALNSVLRGISLDFSSRAALELSKWIHVEDATPSSKWAQTRVDTWRRQFQVVDPTLGPLLADAILRRLRVLPTQHAVDCAMQHGLPGPYGIIEDEIGKSWGVISNVLKKGLGSKSAEAEIFPILPIHEAVTMGAQDGRLVRIVEDGLFSATELLAVVESLVGARIDGGVKRRQKTPPLANVAHMYSARQEWAYGCVTDYGQIMFHAMVRVYGNSPARAVLA